MGSFEGYCNTIIALRALKRVLLVPDFVQRDSVYSKLYHLRTISAFVAIELPLRE